MSSTKQKTENKEQKTFNMCLHAPNVPNVVAVVNVVNSSTSNALTTNVINAIAHATAAAASAVAVSDTSSEHDSMPSLIEEEEEDENESYDSEDNVPIRAKWQMDGATTLDEAIGKLQNFIEHIKSLKNDGWELVDPINDDWGFIRRTGQIID